MEKEMADFQFLFGFIDMTEYERMRTYYVTFNSFLDSSLQTKH
ncbi:hypothetical protein YN1HA_18240 [Sulfurisphaera ohwakuensis]